MNAIDVVIGVAIGFPAFVVGYVVEFIIVGFNAGRNYVKAIKI